MFGPEAEGKAFYQVTLCLGGGKMEENNAVFSNMVVFISFLFWFLETGKN